MAIGAIVQAVDGDWGAAQGAAREGAKATTPGEILKASHDVAYNMALATAHTGLGNELKDGQKGAINKAGS